MQLQLVRVGKQIKVFASLLRLKNPNIYLSAHRKCPSDTLHLILGDPKAILGLKE